MQVSTTWALTCPETVHQRPCMTREIETLLSDSRVGNNSLVETIGKATFRPSSRLERKQISSGAEFQPNRQTTTYSGPNLNQQTARLCRCLVRVTRSKCRELTQTSVRLTLSTVDPTSLRLTGGKFSSRRRSTAFVVVQTCRWGVGVA